MGQNPSKAEPEGAETPDVDWDKNSTCGFKISSPGGISDLTGQVARQTRSLHQLSATSYPEFLASVQELNQISSHFLDSNGKQLVFAVKKGTDSTLLWKATVRIACVKVDNASKQIDSYRCLTLKHYLKVYNSLKAQSAAVREFDARAAPPPPKTTLSVDLDLGEIDPSSLDECCICLERKPDVILPCTHSYCLPCIEQWNLDHKTCPVCRETLNSTDDGWVISEGPDSLDIATEIQKSLMNLAD